MLCGTGFTLIEVILVSVLVGILLVAAVPKFAQTSERLRVEHLTFEFAQLLRYAHERAVAQGQTVVWAWNPAARRAQLYDVVESDSRIASAAIDERVARSAALPEGITLRFERAPDDVEGSVQCPDGVPTDADCVHFFPDGTSDPTTLMLGLRELTYTVSVDGTTGQVVPSPGAPAR